MWIVIPTRLTRVRLRGTGRFFCLYCEKMRNYERRAYARSFAVPRQNLWNEFILCCSCESTFDPECLDGSCDAVMEELFVEVPDGAIRVDFRLQRGPRVASDDPDSLVPAANEEELTVPRQSSIVAYSSGRRH